MFQDIDADDAVGLEGTQSRKGMVEVNFFVGNPINPLEPLFCGIQVTLVDVGGKYGAMGGQEPRDVARATADLKDAFSDIGAQYPVNPAVVIDGGGQVVEGFPLAVPCRYRSLFPPSLEDFLFLGIWIDPWSDN